MNLKSNLDIPEELDPWVQDYQINLFQIAWLDDETVGMFHSDFRQVADLFVQLRKKKQHEITEISLSNQELQHAEQVLELFRVMTGEDVFFDVYKENLAKREGRDMGNMFREVFKDELDAAEAKGKAEGEAKGKAEGELTGENRRAVRAFQNAIAMGLSREEAIAISEISDEALASIGQ